MSELAQRALAWRLTLVLAASGLDDQDMQIPALRAEEV